jgi:Golgi apyrase
MPPPTVVDPWLAHRRFGIVIDAGSSGSRLLIYSWKDPRTTAADTRLADTLPKVEKGVQDDQWVAKVEPGACRLTQGGMGRI